MGKLEHEGIWGLAQSCTVRPRCSPALNYSSSNESVGWKMWLWERLPGQSYSTPHLQTHTHLVFAAVWTWAPLGSGTGTFEPHFAHGVCNLRCWQLKIVCILKALNSLQAGGCSLVNKCPYLEHFSSRFCGSRSPFSLESLHFRFAFWKCF